MVSDAVLCQLSNLNTPWYINYDTLQLLSMLMGIDYLAIGFDMEVQPLVSHNAACLYFVSAVCIDVVCSHNLLA